MKITKLPAAPQEAFFQETQFDREIGGTDPHWYLWAGGSTGRRGRGFKRTDGTTENEPKAAKQMRAAKESLKGHPNETAILKLLKGSKDE